VLAAGVSKRLPCFRLGAPPLDQLGGRWATLRCALSPGGGEGAGTLVHDPDRESLYVRPARSLSFGDFQRQVVAGPKFVLGHQAQPNQIGIVNCHPVCLGGDAGAPGSECIFLE